MNNYKNIKIEKSMYNSGKSFSEMLEIMDPSEQYSGTELEGSDAFQRQLKRFNIKVSGANSDKVEKFFQTSDSAVLFPEYVSRAVKQGVGEYNILNDVVAATTKINGIDYRTIQPVLSDSEKNLNDVAEGASIPQVDLKVADKLVTLNKRGKLLVASYEAIRYQRIDLFTIALRQIGAYIAKTQLNDLYNHISDELMANKYEIVRFSNNNSYTFDDFLKFMFSFKDYNMNTILCNSSSARKLLAVSEFKTAASDAKFPLSGEIITPLGAKLIIMNDMSDDCFVGLDSNYAFEYVQSGEITTEYDKLIDRQLERAAITVTSGFNTIFTDAVKLLTKGDA
jgi:hypothetical protein